jgi:hypothetical protein
MFSNNPALKLGLIGAGTGALYGGISSMAKGESPSEQLGSALGGAIGAGIPLALAGRYSPQIKEALQEGLSKAGQRTSSILSAAAKRVPGTELEGYSGGLGTTARSVQKALERSAEKAQSYVPGRGTLRNIGTGGMALAGLSGMQGGMMAGGALSNLMPSLQPSTYGALMGGTAGTVLGGIPGGLIGGTSGALIGSQYDQNVITDPELTGSSNTPGARSSTPTLRYIS